MQKQAQYLGYRLGLVCSHPQIKSSTNYFDIACNKHSQTYHRISQATKICNKCSAQIMRCVNSVDQCPCCSDSLQMLISSAWICNHSNRSYDQITICCINDQKDMHQVPFRNSVCKGCYEKIRAAFMFSNQCLVCNQKESQVFQNIEKTITKSSFYFFEDVIKQMKNNKCSQEEINNQLEHYCLAEPRSTQFKSKYENQSKDFGENLLENHQSKRYQLFPKCAQHRYKPISLCNNCLVSILNVKSCPYGCPYENKQVKVGKVEAPIINQSGFLCLYPKQTKDSQYLEYFSVRHIEESNRIDKWQGSIRKIKYEGNDNICDKFGLYSASVQVGNRSFFMSGGGVGGNIFTMKTTKSAFLVNLSEKSKTFSIEQLPDMFEGRASHALMLCGDYVYAIGGFNKEQKKAMASCEKFNLKTKKWEKMSSLKIERSKATVFQSKGKIYALGGFSMNQEIWNSIGQCYNPEKDTWEICQYKGYDVPYINGAAFANNCWGLSELDNIFLLGGSNYEIATYFMQEMQIKPNGFNLDYVDIEKKLNFTRSNSSISVMKTDSDSEKILLVFGGVLEHESLMSFDAVRTKIVKNQISPIFVYEEVSVGSYRFLLRENHQSAYHYMIKKLIDQGLLSKEKLENKEETEILKSDALMHMIEKMWYGVGKCIVGYSQ